MGDDFSLFLFSGATVPQVKARFDGIDSIDLAAKLQEVLSKEPLIDKLHAEVQRLRRMHSARA
jgi:hypothetical protein